MVSVLEAPCPVEMNRLNNQCDKVLWWSAHGPRTPPAGGTWIVLPVDKGGGPWVVGAVWLMPGTQRGLRMRIELKSEYKIMGTTVSPSRGTVMGGPSWLGLSVLISGTWTLEEPSLLSNPGRKRSWRLHRGPRGRREWGDGEAACIEPLWSGGHEGSQGALLGQRTGPSCFPPFQRSPPTPHVAPWRPACLPCPFQTPLGPRMVLRTDTAGAPRLKSPLPCLKPSSFA